MSPLRPIPFLLSILAIAGCSGEPTAGADPAGSGEAARSAAGATGLAFPTGRWTMTTTLTDLSIRSSDPSARAGERMLREAIGKAQTSTVCIDRQMVERGLADLDQARGSCEPKTKRIADGVIDVVMTCRSPDGALATVTHRGRYAADSLTSTVAMTAAAPKGTRPAGEGIDMTISNTGRRLGDCAATKDPA